MNIDTLIEGWLSAEKQCMFLLRLRQAVIREHGVIDSSALLNHVDLKIQKLRTEQQRYLGLLFQQYNWSLWNRD